MHALIVLNPHAGGGAARRLIAPLQGMLASLGGGLRWCAHEHWQESLAEIQACPRGSRIVVMGGDGTLNRYLPALLAGRHSLGLVPCGSGNDLARTLTEQPARQVAMLSRQVIGQAVPADKQEATLKQVDAELKKYMEGALPVAKASANKAGKAALAEQLDKNFTEAELKDLVTILESPVLKKYQGLMPELTSALAEKVAADARPSIAPKVQATEAAVKKILDGATGGKFSQMIQQAQAAHAAQQASGAAPAAAPAKK